ncbi:unnamed protein product [Ceutorhynchus assimilis]|uniref:Uncharacterized protein n=1 Tax=Ceutorhynchus assimilis TaxID=467358 RepID=A0A9N9QID1_9CUCU|nr:unnamed protein product [Ceutorhynchus assimilis]
MASPSCMGPQKKISINVDTSKTPRLLSSGAAYQLKVFQAASSFATENSHLQMRWFFNCKGEIVIDSLVRVPSDQSLVLYDGKKNEQYDEDNEITAKRSRLSKQLPLQNASISRQLQELKIEVYSDLEYHSSNDDWSIVIDRDMFSVKGKSLIEKLTMKFNASLESDRFYRISLRRFSNVVVNKGRCALQRPKRAFVIKTDKHESVDECLSPNEDQQNIVKEIENVLDRLSSTTDSKASSKSSSYADSNVILVNSVAGSGKTTMLYFLRHRKILYLATSKKLVAEGSEYGVEAQTICKFFMKAFGWRFDEYVEAVEELTSGDSWEKSFEENHYDGIKERYDIIFIDEVSLIQSTLLRELTRIAGRHTLVVTLVGDVNQLSAIGADEHDLYKCLSYVDRVFFIKQHMRSKCDPRLTGLLRQFEAGDAVNFDTLKTLQKSEIGLRQLFNYDGSFREFRFISKNNSNVVLLNMALLKLRYILFETETYFERCHLVTMKPGKVDEDLVNENDITVALQVGAPYVCLADTCKPKGTRFRLKTINRGEDGLVMSVDVEHDDGTILTLYRRMHEYTLYGREHSRVGFPLLADLAVSVHRCQGSTFKGTVYIEMNKMSRCEAYVCLSRATHLRNIQLL